MRPRKLKKPRRVFLGWYELGGHKIHVTFDPKESGGSFTGNTMTIGGPRDWPHTVGILVHETMEMTLAHMDRRYVPSADEAQASDGYFFAMDHAAFSEASARVGNFIAQVLPPLSRAFKGTA